MIKSSILKDKGVDLGGGGVASPYKSLLSNPPGNVNGNPRGQDGPYKTLLSNPPGPVNGNPLG